MAGFTSFLWSFSTLSWFLLAHLRGQTLDDNCQAYFGEFATCPTECTSPCTLCHTKLCTWANLDFAEYWTKATTPLVVDENYVVVKKNGICFLNGYFQAEADAIIPSNKGPVFAGNGYVGILPNWCRPTNDELFTTTNEYGVSMAVLVSKTTGEIHIVGYTIPIASYRNQISEEQPASGIIVPDQSFYVQYYNIEPDQGGNGGTVKVKILVNNTVVEQKLDTVLRKLSLSSISFYVDTNCPQTNANAVQSNIEMNDIHINNNNNNNLLQMWTNQFSVFFKKYGLILLINNSITVSVVLCYFLRKIIVKPKYESL